MPIQVIEDAKDSLLARIARRLQLPALMDRERDCLMDRASAQPCPSFISQASPNSAAIKQPKQYAP
jgi:hypothetical protein